ncbi:MAG: tetratricopeptide repeat protein [Nanoarchaeota archaeon]
MKKRSIFIIGIVFIILFSVFAFAGSQVILYSKEKIDTASGDLYLSLGNTFYKQGNTEEAVKWYLKGLEYEPDNEFVLNNVGFYYIEKGNYAQAEAYLQRAVAKDQYYETARNNLAVLYNKEKRYDEAIQQLLVLTKIDPNNPSYQYDLGINLADLFREENIGNLDDAIIRFQTAIELSPGYAHAEENIKALNEVKVAMGIV